MSRTTLAAALGCLALTATLAACNQPEAETPEAAASPTLHEVMLNQIDAHADQLWDITNPALDEQAQIDPSLLSEAQWQEIAMRAGEVQSGAQALAAMDPITVAAPGVTISDEEVEFGHTAAEVQDWVDENPELFREMAGTLAAHMGEIVAAANARDAVKLTPLVDQLDSVCESCHLHFWYPEQRELVESIQNQAAAGE